MTISVLVVDDQALIRQAVRDILMAAPGIVVVGEAREGAGGARLARTLTPDVVLMDIRMPEVDGIRATASIVADPALTRTRVLILTTFEEDEYVLAALRAGASGFLGKGAEPDEIVRAVEAVAAGEALLSPAATRALISRFVRPGNVGPETIPDELSTLTEREREVLLLVGRGRSNHEIAEELLITPLTAKTHVNRVMTKVSAHDRAQLVILAYESGLLAPGS